MVHFNAKYGTLDKAIEHKDGLAVLGILIETQKRDNVAFRHFVTQFPQVLEEGYKTTLSSPIPLIDLLPDNTDNFYRYNGSLVISSFLKPYSYINKIFVFKTDDASLPRNSDLDCLRHTYSRFRASGETGLSFTLISLKWRINCLCSFLVVGSISRAARQGRTFAWG